MSIGDLDWLFSPAGELASAQKLFSDRLPEQRAFDEAIAVCTKRLRPTSEDYHDPQDLGAARRNVLHFFGMGGIGKTELMHRLRERAQGNHEKTQHWDKYRFSGSTIIASYDFARQHSPTPEGLLLSIRQSLAASGSKCPAFDLLIARYWAFNHPGESLQGYLAKRGQFDILDERTGLSQQIEASIGEVASALLGLGVGVSGSALVKLAKTTASAVTTMGLKRTALRECKRLEDMLRAPPTLQAIPYYATALAWDLSRSKGKDESPSLLIVFLDHLEEIDPQLERMVQQIVWLLPNALFVTSGRNFLRWANPTATGLFRTGSNNWPTLGDDAEGEPRQHRVGPLSQRDTIEFLQRALADNDMTAAEIAEVANASGGFPYHLDLMVQHWAEIGKTRAAKQDDLLVPFPDLARRVLRDLQHRERRALFACTLFDCFDSELIAKTANVEDGLARHLLKKPLFQRTGSGNYPLSLDRTLRDMFLTLAEEGYEDWSAADWQNMAVSALDQVRSKAGESASSAQKFWLAQGLQIARRFNLEADWLVSIAISCAEGADWDPSWKVSDLTGANDLNSNWMTAFSQALELIFARQTLPRDKVASDLLRITSIWDTDPKFDIVKYFAAEALRDSGDIAQARELFSTLSSNGSDLAGKARHGSIHLLRREGKILEATNMVREAYNILPTPERLLGEILWTQGQFSEAAQHFVNGRDRAAKLGHVGEHWLCCVYHAFAISWIQPEEGRRIMSAYTEIRPEFSSSFADGFEHLVAHLTGPCNRQDIQQRWFDGRRTSGELKQTSLVCYQDFATVFLSIVANEPELCAEAYHALQESCRSASILYLLEVADVIVGNGSAPSNTHWVDEFVGSRWQSAARTPRSN